MLMCPLVVLKKSSRKKETEKENEMIKVSNYASGRRKKAGKYKIEMIKFLTSTLYLLARLTLALIFSFCFQKENITSFNETLSCCLYFAQVVREKDCLMWK